MEVGHGAVDLCLQSCREFHCMQSVGSALAGVASGVPVGMIDVRPKDGTAQVRQGHAFLR